MKIIIKVLQIFGNRDYEVCDFLGKHFLYPEGTERKVKIFIFPLFKIKIVIQKAKITSTVDIESVIYFNKWEYVQK